MDRKKDPEMQILTEDLLKEAEEIDREIAEANMDPIPLEVKERIKSNLVKQIDAYEKEHLYAHLSEEDRKALEVGRKVLENKENVPSENMVMYRKKRIRMFHVLAAVIVLVLAMGVTSIGGPERVIEMMKVAIGGREVVRVDTEEDNYVVRNENEEEAYQKLGEIFGVDPVRSTRWPKNTEFWYSDIDEELQTAILGYLNEDNYLQYFISSHYTESSWGLDIEDEITDEYYIVHPENIKILIREYESYKSKYKSYSAQFTYNGLEYVFTGVIEKEELEVWVKNLKFF